MQLFDIELRQEDNLLKKFEEIHDFIYANDGLSPQQTLNEFLKILFIKIFDENNNLCIFRISAEEYQNLRSNKGNSPIVENINLLFDKTKQEYPDLFDNDEKIKLSKSSLGFVINKLQNISLTDSSSDAKGLAFQKFLSHKEKEGKGQFFTPEPVVNFCVEMINPTANETVIDPCCGSGGFVFSAFQHIIKNNRSVDKQQIIKNNLFGIDINKDIAKIARMKLLLEANVKSNIFCHNSLDDIDAIKLLLSEHTHQSYDGFDVLLTNPPFGTAGKITDNQILSKYDLGYKWIKTENGFSKSSILSNGQPAEILFVERCLQLLREGGRMAIVLPNGHFENPSLEYLRYYIKLKAKILGVVNLPQETFIPYGTAVKTSLLFLEKETLNATKQYPLFFGKIKRLGYQGNKNGTPIYKKNNFGQLITENGNSVLDEDFSMVVADYQLFCKFQEIKTDNSFSIDYIELNGRFDYDFYSPENQNVLSKLSKKSVRLGDIVEIVKTKSTKLKDKNAVVEYVELSDVNAHSFEIINSTQYAVHELPSRASYELKEDDIVTAIAGNSVGTRKHATALVSSEYAGAICTNGFRVLRNPKIDKFYLLFFLHSELFLKQMMMYRTGAAIPNVSDNDLMNVLVYLPDETTIQNIGNQMKCSFSLRTESAKMIENIQLV
ncbi:MAG: N-6 DNA methylase [Bacteroidales bacterium]|jgi:type I restriction enzyme M protein|nr:N-6 DNA methylase [Bacteroidales bacterium]MDD2205016.1 N-6 DNA methylase [Bacteroidales bacterium]MDD3152412.1 N-6 DNA methylase [Bacteroidales bacterium]MDD3914494.1 N-6 DNA methylase [Bacteroidales bacterium]MDD4634407.1 N-6 DNA methylase [Bacteroidales bacterium]